MGFIVDAIEDAVSGVWDAIDDAVSAAWDDLITPMLEEVFGWFGIVDENITIVNKVSQKIFGNNTEDVIHAANVKSVMDMALQGQEFFPMYMKHTRLTAAQVKGFYKYADDERYIHGLPNLTIKGIDYDQDAIVDALHMLKGDDANLISSQNMFPSDEIYFKEEIQAYPYYYLPWANTLNADDPHSIPRTDWELGVLTYNAGPNNWDYAYSRVAENAIFWIEGPVHIVEGDSATYTITCNRTVPAGTSVQINLSYGGTASGSDYTAVANATMTAGNNTVQFTVSTNEDIIVQGSRTVIVTMASLAMSGEAFEEVTIGVLNSVTTTITDDEGIILTMPSVLADETTGSAVIPVKLEAATAGAFIVNYGFTDGTALGGGVDYDSTPGILNFAGTAGEVQNITVPLTTADGDDDKEYFTVNLTACDDPAVDITQTATVTITDGTEVDPPAGTIVIDQSILLPGYTKESSMLFTFYYDHQTSAEWRYLLYKYSDGTYPDIIPSMGTISNLDMMPIGILRHDKTFIDVDKGTEEYKTTKRLLDFLGFKIDDFITNLSENEYIADVTDAFLNFAINPNDTGKEISKILYIQFYETIVVNGIVSNVEQYTMSFEEQDVKNAVVWAEHSYTVKSGVLASGQEYEHEVALIPEISEELVPGEGLVVTQEQESNLYIRKQLTPTTYGEIFLKTLNSLASISYGEFSDMVLNKVGDTTFTIPISYYALKDLHPLEIMVAYQDIARLDMYSLQVVEVAWYESDAFMNLFQFAMIVITVVTAGLAAGPLAVLQQLLINYLIVELVVFLAELTGSAELAAIVGLVAMLVLSSAAGLGSIDFTSATGLVNASTQFADNLTVAYDTEIQLLQDDMRDLNVKATERLEEIKEAGEAGGLNDTIDLDFASMLKSVDTTMYPAQKAQYNFDLIYNYDTLIAQYHDNHLQKGVI